MTPWGFKLAIPANVVPQIHALDREGTGVNFVYWYLSNNGAPDRGCIKKLNQNKILTIKSLEATVPNNGFELLYLIFVE